MNLSKPNTFEVAQIYGSGCTKVRDNRKKAAGMQGGGGGRKRVQRNSFITANLPAKPA